MKGKKLFAMLLALVMACSVFAGCSGGGGSNSGSGSSAAEESATAEESGESGEDSQAEAGSTGEITWEDPYEVVMCYIYFGTLSEDLQMVEDAMNEIALEKTNTQVSLLPLSFSEISTQPSLMISSGEKLDLLLSPAQSDLMNYYNSNMLLELDELVEEYGQDILAAKSDVLDVGRIDGQLYAITGTRQHYNSQGLMVVTEYAEKYGLDASQPVGYEELDAFFAAAKEGEGDSFYPFLISGTNVTSFEFFQRMDTLGADMACGSIIDYQNSQTVENVFASEEYATHLDWMRKWYEAGYINGDAVTNTESTQSLVENGLGCSYMLSTYWDMESNQEQGVQMDMTAVPMTQEYVTNGALQGWTWSIPYTSENPEATMAFLNLTYADRELTNMFYYGIEGVHYNLVDEAGIFEYPEGIDTSNRTYGNPMGCYGDVSNMYQDAAFWDAEYFDLQEEYNTNIPEEAYSPFMGYTFNPEPVSSAYSAVTDVMTQYRSSLETGSVDPDVVLPEFLSALEAAGIDSIIEANQASLDEWLAQQ